MTQFECAIFPGKSLLAVCLSPLALSSLGTSHSAIEFGHSKAYWRLSISKLGLIPQ